MNLRGTRASSYGKVIKKFYFLYNNILSNLCIYVPSMSQYAISDEELEKSFD